MKIRWLLLLLTVLLFPSRGNAIGIYKDQDNGLDPEVPACLLVYEAKTDIAKGRQSCRGRSFPTQFDYCLDKDVLMEAVTENSPGVPLPAQACGKRWRYVEVHCEGLYFEEKGVIGKCEEVEAIQPCQSGASKNLAGRCVPQ